MSRWKLIVAVLIAAATAFAAVRYFGADEGGAARGNAGRNEGPIPVSFVPVVRENVPVILDALGTVQALNTVTVRPQVGGQIEAIAFEEGQQIERGALIAKIDARPYQAQLDQALAKQQQDQAQLDGARSTLQRYENLVKQGYVSAQDLENQRHTVAQLEALIGADEAAVANARVQLGYTIIRAPISGVAGLRQVDVGNIVQAGQSTGLVVLTQVHPINAVFTLPEQHLDLVRRAGAAAKRPLPVSARDRGDDRVIAQGELRVIDNQIDSSTGTFKLKAEFANADMALWPGQFVNLRLQLSTAMGTVIPPQALQRGPEGSYVYLIQNDDTVMMQPVEPGAETGDGKVLITQGLEAGQRVVTEGQFRLKPGSKVMPLAPGQAAPPAAPAAGPPGEPPHTSGRTRS